MTETRHWIKTLVVTGLLGFPLQGYADVGGEGPAVPPQDGSISKTVLHAGQEVENLLKPTAWQAIEEGYRREVSVFSCDNGGDAWGRRGVLQRVVLNQQRAQPIVASAWSKAEGVTGTIDSDYALYLDLAYYDGTELWGQVAGFRTGTHGWQREEVVLFPEKPIKAVDFNLLFRDHAGKAWFREPVLRQVNSLASSVLFDGVHVVFRGLIAFEYICPIAADMHGTGKLMMANATPDRLCWLTPMLDVLGAETDCNPRGEWRPMDDAHLLYRRALCKEKPYCFLMNTAFENFSHDLVARYMKRALAYGCFPGFFSHNASEGHYFTRPELYERDRDFFRKCVPLCKVVAEAGWEPITGARSGDEHVHIERFGDQGTRYLTVFNDSPERRDTTITLSLKASETSRELVRGKRVSWTSGKTTVALDPEDMAVLELRP